MNAFSTDDPRVTKGWFSRRHKTSEAHVAAQRVKEAKESDWLATMEENARERAKRTPAEQIAVLDARLGKNKGAKKERKRLLAQIKG